MSEVSFKNDVKEKKEKCWFFVKQQRELKKNDIQGWFTDSWISPKEKSYHASLQLYPWVTLVYILWRQAYKNKILRHHGRMVQEYEYCHNTIIVDVKQECVRKGWKWKAVNAVLRKYNFFCVKRFTEEKSLKLSSKTLFDLYAYSIVSNTYLPTHAMLFYSVQFTEVILLNFGETVKNLGAPSNTTNFFVSSTITDQEQEVRMRADLTISLIIVKCPPRIQTHYKH